MHGEIKSYLKNIYKQGLEVMQSWFAAARLQTCSVSWVNHWNVAAA
jgi:hypothetical protein